MDTQEDRERFAGWLEARRRSAGLNKGELARRANVSRSTVSAVTNAKGEDVSSGMVGRLGAAVGASLGESLAAAGMLAPGVTPETFDLARRLESLGARDRRLLGALLRGMEADRGPA